MIVKISNLSTKRVVRKGSLQVLGPFNVTPFLGGIKVRGVSTKIESILRGLEKI